MRNHAFNHDFALLTSITDMCPRLNDSEISGMNGLKDLYGAHMQFGDPIIFLHFPQMVDLRMREVEFLDLMGRPQSIFSHSSQGIKMQRQDKILALLGVFPDARMINEMNILRASNDYSVLYMRKNHLIMRHRP